MGFLGLATAQRRPQSPATCFCRPPFSDMSAAGDDGHRQGHQDGRLQANNDFSASPPTSSGSAPPVQPGLLQQLQPAIANLLLSKDFVSSLAAAVKDSNAAERSTGNSAASGSSGLSSQRPFLRRADEQPKEKRRDKEPSASRSRSRSRTRSRSRSRSRSHSASTSDRHSSNEDGHSGDDEGRSRRKRKRRSDSRQKPKSFKVPRFTATDDITWKGAASTNKMCHARLAQIVKKLHCFRVNFLDPAAPQDQIASYNSIMGEMVDELEYIEMAEDSPFGWATSKEVQKQRKRHGGSSSTRKAISRAEAKLNKAKKEAKNQRPFPNRPGGGGGSFRQGRQNGPPRNTNNAQPRQFQQQKSGGSLQRGCFLCNELGHFQKECPLNPANKK